MLPVDHRSTARARPGAAAAALATGALLASRPARSRPRRSPLLLLRDSPTTAVTVAPPASGPVPTTIRAASLRPTSVRGWSNRATTARVGVRLVRSATVSGPPGRPVVLQRASGRQLADRHPHHHQPARRRGGAIHRRGGDAALPARRPTGGRVRRRGHPRRRRPRSAADHPGTRNPPTPAPVPAPSPHRHPSPCPPGRSTPPTAPRSWPPTAAGYLPLTTITTAWTGSVAGCNAGSQPPRVQQATLAAVNYYRAQAGLRPVALDDGLSARAQQAALLMSANGRLDHVPPATWTCWNATAADAAGHSNLAIWGGSRSAAFAIDLYMDDSGVPSVGHRSWVLNPSGTVIGSGTVDRANALLVIDARNVGDPPAGTPTAVAWPNAGYVPRPLVPEQYWSVLFPAASASDLTGSVVTATGAAGPIAVAGVHVVSGYGGGSALVWTMPAGAVPAGAADAAVTVRITGPRPLAYTVTAVTP